MPTTFTPPGAGQWDLDRSHFTGGTTPIMQMITTNTMRDAFLKQWAQNGVPARTVDVRWVNGFYYSRLRPLVAPDKSTTRLPPTWVLKAMTRLHPEFRKRNRAAQRSLEDNGTAEVIAEWHSTIRPDLVAKNLALGRVELDALDDHQLAAHTQTCLDHLSTTMEEHFRLHGFDLAGIGQLIKEARGWGIAGSDVVPTLIGASPSTAAPLEALAAIRAELQAAGVEPATLDDVRAASPRAAELLDDYLDRRGSVLYAGYDIDTPTLGEAPDVILSTIRNASGPNDVAARASAEAAALRARVPAEERDRFDELLAAAREAMDLRDDNGPITIEWPAGLLRLGLLEAGRRLHAHGRLHDITHVFDLGPDEVGPVIRGEVPEPNADTLQQRALERAACRQLDPPLTLGPAEPTPPPEALPSALAEVIDVVTTVMAELGMADVDEADDIGLVHGMGIGGQTLRGKACVASDADEAFDNLGDATILVTRTTSPAYNMVLGLVEGLVTAEGGPMCHAAVLSRELDLTAVIGARSALNEIRHGDTVELDPQAGTVTVVETAR